MKTYSAFICIFIILLFNDLIFSQNNTYEIQLMYNKKFPKIVLKDIKNDTLVVTSSYSKLLFPIDSIKFLIRPKKSHIAKGLFYGVLIGGISGYFISRSSMNKKDVDNESYGWGLLAGSGMGILLGGSFGTLTGIGMGKDEVLNFTTRNHEEKIVLLKKLIEENKIYHY